MSTIRLFSLGLCVITACTFEGGGEGGQGGPDNPSVGVDAPGTEETPNPNPTPFVSQCDASDPDLRLCLEFENPEVFLDHSTHAQVVDVTNVDVMPRTPGQAAKTDFGAKLAVRESASLDVDRLTISMWINARQLGTSQYLFDNQGQYSLHVQPDGTIRCDVGTDDWLNSDTMRDQPVIPGRWVHVACTYDRNEIAVFVDGQLEDCTSSSVQLEKSPALGSTVGGNLGVGGTVTNPFFGGLDFVKVYNRALSPTEICTAAGKTGCEDRCQRGPD